MGSPLTALGDLARAATLVDQLPRLTSQLLWARVASTTPLTVVLEIDGTATPREAANAIGALAVDARVYVELRGGRLTVLGPAATVATGGNGDGRWWRSPDGTQICWQRVQTTSAATSPYGSLHLLRHQWTFPIPFLEPPAVTVGRLQLGTGAALIASTEEPTATQCMLRAMDVVARPQGTPLYVTATAVGRWR